MHLQFHIAYTSEQSHNWHKAVKKGLISGEWAAEECKEVVQKSAALTTTVPAWLVADGIEDWLLILPDCVILRKRTGPGCVVILRRAPYHAVPDRQEGFLRSNIEGLSLTDALKSGMIDMMDDL